ncbi:MAG: metallophosphoesterase family protein [Planctomycetota bacterium]
MKVIRFGIRYLVIACPLTVVFLTLAARSFGHDGLHPAVKVEPATYYKPSVMPDRIVLTWCDDPTTTQAVTWRTSTEVTNALAQITVATPGPDLDQGAADVAAETTPLQTDINQALFHTAKFTELKPGTKYAYRVGDGANWSEWFQFSTADKDAKRFSFVYFGDAQNDIRSKWSRVIREAYGDAPNAAFLLHAGDLVNQAESDAEWGEWCGAGGWLNAMTPSIAVPGNHEQARDETGQRRLSHHWKPQFAFPENGPAGFEEECYTLVYGNTRIIALNSTKDYDIQAEWMEKVLSSNDSMWVVCTFHHPVFSTGKDRDNASLRAAWKPILDKYNVDLVLQGHDHSYGRTGLSTPTAGVELEKINVPTGVNTFDKHTGTVYVVSVSGPKMYSLNKKSFMKRGAANTQLYQVITVDDQQLTFEARTAAGNLYDRFVLKKRKGEPNELIEFDAPMSERRTLE